MVMRGGKKESEWAESLRIVGTKEFEEALGR
jgi:hypothetical protein